MNTINLSFISIISAVSILGCAANETGPVAEGSLVVAYADPGRGVAAVWDDGVDRLELRAWTDASGMVRSTITDRGHIVTRLEIPLAAATDVSDQLGPRARDEAWSKTHRDGDPKRWLQLMPVYEQALASLYTLTEDLGDSSLRMALPWHEEVLARLVVGDALDSTADDACLDGEGPVHTNLVHRPELMGVRAKAAGERGGGAELPADGSAELACDLGCSWYDICCHHDEACAACDRWWCGWSCTRGCSGGDCGGGR